MSDATESAIYRIIGDAFHKYYSAYQIGECSNPEGLKYPRNKYNDICAYIAHKVILHPAVNHHEELVEMLKKLTPEDEHDDRWWCRECMEWKIWSSVTYTENCDDCGEFLGGNGNDEIDVIVEARALLATIKKESAVK